jgi:uncharacterized RDD family membrane protein YckC
VQGVEEDNEEILSIVTPEGVRLEFQTAGVASRAQAAFIDMLIRFFASSILAYPFLIVGAFAGAVGGVLSLIAYVLVIFFYPVPFEVWAQGRTPGKAILGLQAITIEGTPVRFRHSFLRTLMLLVDFWAPLPGGGVGFLSLLATKHHQRVGDLVAGTYVIRVRKADSKVMPVWFSPPAGFEAYARSLDVALLTPEQYGLIRSYLVRSGRLSQEARQQMGETMADSVCRTLNHTPPAGMDPLGFLQCTAAAYQVRTAG